VPDLKTFQTVLASGIYWVVLVYFFIVVALITFIRQLDQKFGPGVLWKMMKGQYYKPKVEERIFMFLDLRSSTTIAETLGHITYSQLIQDCFFDLNEITPKFQAEIYQYVGDEAVLTWELDRGLNKNNCVELYFNFIALINSKASYYKDKYGVIPDFKAGVHFGNITVAEVGVVKKEIAFHGDTINTAARIQAMCNQLKQKLLISKELLTRLIIEDSIVQVHLGEILLKGREQRVHLYGLQTKDITHKT
jgi:adenylate cyclase